MRARKLRFGHEGYAQPKDGLDKSNGGEAGEREELDEVVDGGEAGDFSAIQMGFAKADIGERDAVDDEGESELSLLLSENIFLSRRAPRVMSQDRRE